MHHLHGDADAHTDRARRLGCWSEWNWDGSRLRVRCDRLGFAPMFYAVWNGNIAVSPSLLELVRAGAPTHLDEPALAAFLRLGFFLAEDTPFAAIRALPPGAALEWCEGHLSLHAEGPLILPESSLSRSNAIDAYIDIFRTAIRRRLPAGDDVAVPLSAGRDSRFILAELCRAGSAPRECVTILHPPPRANHDVRVARSLARELNIPHVVLRQNRSRMRAELEKNELTHFCADEHAWYLPLVDHLAASAPRVYDGLAGDTLARPHNFPRAKATAFLRAGVQEQARMLATPDAYRDRMLRSGRSGALGEAVAVERIATELRRHRDAPNPIGSFYLWNRTRREISLAPFSVLGGVARVSTPYLDRDVFRHLASLPYQHLTDDRFRTDVIERAHPELGHIPFEGEGRRSPGRRRAAVMRRARALAHFVPFAATLLRYTRRCRNSRLIDRRYLMARLAVDVGRLNCEEIEGYGTMALYLQQLEQLAGERITASFGPQATSGPSVGH